jgi:hypothetical protein
MMIMNEYKYTEKDVGRFVRVTEMTGHKISYVAEIVKVEAAPHYKYDLMLLKNLEDESYGWSSATNISTPFRITLLPPDEVAMVYIEGKF